MLATSDPLCNVLHKVDKDTCEHEPGFMSPLKRLSWGNIFDSSPSLSDDNSSKASAQLCTENHVLLIGVLPETYIRLSDFPFVSIKEIPALNIGIIAQ